MSIDASPAPPVQLLLTPPEAARALSISPRKLWSLTKAGAIRAVRIDRSVRYSVVDLAAFVESRRSAP